MYYPYLRSKQNEMLALREISQSTIEHSVVYSHITPIIEPIRDLPTLDKTIDEMEKAHIPYAVILNAGDNKVAEVYQWLSKEGRQYYAPAFLCDDSIPSIQDLDTMPPNIMLVFKNHIDSDNEKLLPLFANQSVKTIVGSMSRSLKRKLLQEQKQLVTFSPDAFHPQNTNALYGNTPDELYTEEHTFYKEEQFAGFSDFCVLPKNLQDKGMMPTTLAIHLTYKKNDDEIWVRHFLSDTQLGRENIQRKFQETAIHVRNFYATNPTTVAVKTLLKCLEDGHYPGLGKLKEFSVWNHLELVNRLLEDNK